MNNYKKVENLLYNYKMLKISIKNIEEEIEYLDKECGVSGINYDNTGTSPTNKVNSIVEDTALSISEKKHYLQHKINEIEMQLNKIERAMEGLTDIERIIIEQKYIEGLQWWQIAGQVKYSERWCRQLRTEAIKKLVTGIYGTR